MKLLIVGAGRMGLRHLRGLATRRSRIDVVDPRPEANAAIGETLADLGPAASAEVIHHPDLRSALDGSGRHDAAVLATTAAERGTLFAALAAAGIPRVLVEKPLEQSRQAARDLAKTAKRHGIMVHCNLYRRTLPAYAGLPGRGPFTITVSSGAMGLGCNGIHWIDFARMLSGGAAGRLVHGEVQEVPIASGRGAQFRDYGGHGVFAFEDGSRLFLSVRADSNAPTAFGILGPRVQWVVDQHQDQAAVHERDPASTKPAYLYGQDYATRTVNGGEAVDFPALTLAWLNAALGEGSTLLPTMEEALPAHELLFDLLELTGERRFPIT